MHLDANLDASGFVSLSVPELFLNPHKQLLSDYKMVSHLVSFPYPPHTKSPVMRTNIMNTIPTPLRENEPKITTHKPAFNSDEKPTLQPPTQIENLQPNIIDGCKPLLVRAGESERPNLDSENLFWSFGIESSITRIERCRTGRKRVGKKGIRNKRTGDKPARRLQYPIEKVLEVKGEMSLVEWEKSWVLTTSVREESTDTEGS